jgi:L-fuconolactonase
MMIDAHHHLWRPARGDYGWLDRSIQPTLGPICRDVLLPEFQQLAQASGIHGSVLVQAAPTEAETRWLLEQATGGGGLVLGVVGWTDLAAPDAAERIHALSQNPWLKGLRPMLQDLPQVDWIAQPALGAGIHAMQDLGLVLDLLVRTEHLPHALRMLDRHPGIASVIDHAAKPAAHEPDAMQLWAGHIRQLARETDAFCKLSGLVTEVPGPSREGHLQRVVDHLLDVFGPERLIWGSDWPVCTLACGYDQWLALSRTLLRSVDPAGLRGIFGANAQRLYRLRPSPAEADQGGT